MKSVLDFLGVDVDALKKETRTILIDDAGLIQQHMLLRLATRKVEVGGFYVKDFVSDEPYYIFNKRIYGKNDIENDGKKYLLLQCKNNSTPPPEGEFPANLEIIRIAAPKNSKCIIYGAGYQGKNAYFMLDACGAEIVKFCDRDSTRWHTEYFGIEIISPDELKESYADLPVIIGIETGVAEKAAEELCNDNIIREVYFACDPVFSISNDIRLTKWTKYAKKCNVFLGKYKSSFPQVAVLKFLGMNISYIADIDGEIPANNAQDVEIRSPYDISYENADELAVFMEWTDRQRGEDFLKKLGLAKEIYSELFPVRRRNNGYLILDPNLGHNVEYKGKSSVITLSTKGKKHKNIIAAVGGSTSEVCYCEEISWPEQFISVAKNKNISVKMLAGGTAAYLVSQELVKFIRDISFKKPDILISYSGCNDINADIWVRGKKIILFPTTKKNYLKY